MGAFYRVGDGRYRLMGPERSKKWETELTKIFLTTRQFDKLFEAVPAAKRFLDPELTAKGIESLVFPWLHVMFIRERE